jgi:hypothetical protein
MKLSFEQLMNHTRKAPDFFAERWGSALREELTGDQRVFTNMLNLTYFNFFNFTILPPQEKEVKVYLQAYDIARSGNRDYRFIMKILSQDIEHFLRKYGIYN